MRPFILRALLLEAGGLRHAVAFCTEGRCRDGSTPGYALICGSGRWQLVPFGAFKCVDGQLVPSFTAALGPGDYSTFTSTISVTSTTRSTSTLLVTKSAQSASLQSSVVASSLPYRSFHGDGSVRQGWPSIGQWIPFNDM